jgi:hypothetical protein
MLARRGSRTFLGAASVLVVLALTATALAAPPPVATRDVYLNGVKLDASVVLRPQTFNGCEVRIDDRGDVYITAKGYSVISQPAPSQPRSASPPPPVPIPPPAPIPPPQKKDLAVDLAKNRVWLISKQTQRGAVQYDVDVLVNGALVRKVKSVEDPVVLDITRYIKSGVNTVRLSAQKNIPDRRVSMSPTDTLEVVIGEGTLGGSTVNIERVLVDFLRNAQETDPITEDFTVAAR